jgi:hypothetical protein
VDYSTGDAKAVMCSHSTLLSPLATAHRVKAGAQHALPLIPSWALCSRHSSLLLVLNRLSALNTQSVNCAGSLCDQRNFRFFVPHGRIHGRTRGCKGSLLKGMEFTKGSLVGGQVESAVRERVLLFLSYFKSDSHPIISERGGA